MNEQITDHVFTSGQASLNYLKKFLPSDIYQECEERNRNGNNTAKDQFEAIKHLPLINV